MLLVGVQIMARKAKRGVKPGTKRGPYKKAKRITLKDYSDKYEANETWKLTDRDVTSYYPNCILNLGLYPIAAGPNFLKVFKGFKDSRVEAKRAKNFTKDKGLKIFLNGKLERR